MSEEIKQTMIVTRYGEPDTDWINALEAEAKREALYALGNKVVTLATAPIRNFSLNMLDLLREHSLQVK